MTRHLNRLGHFCASRPWRVIGVWLVLAIAVVAASGSIGRELDDTFAVPGLDSQRAVDLLESAGSDDAGLTAQVVATPLDGSTFSDSSKAASDLESLHRAIAALPNVVAITDPAYLITTDPNEAVATGMVSSDGRIAVIRIQYPVLEDLDVSDLSNLQTAVARAADGSSLQIEAAGDLFFAFDEPETNVGELLGLLAAVIVLLVAFGSVVAMGLPIGMALFGLALGISSLSLVTYVVAIPSWAPVLASMVGLGVGIDYALLVVTRHREFLRSGMSVPDAAATAVATAGRAVLFAGGVVVVSILGLAVAGIPFVTAAGVAISFVVLIMVAASLTLLPAFLGLAGTRVDRFALPWTHSSRSTGDVGAWHRWGSHVADHAVPYAVGTTAVLLLLATPVLSLRLGYPDDGTLPESFTQRRAYDLVSVGFGPGANGPLVIAVDLAGDPAIVDTLSTAIAADDGIAAIGAVTIDADAGIASIVAQPTTAPQDPATYATIERLRTDVFPAVLAASPATAHVGGQTANFSDVSARVSDRLLLFIGAVVAMSFVLLLFVFRSILVPLKAAVLNLLSIGAAYGVLVMVFQWGWGGSLIGLEGPVPIVSFIPMFMFAIVFGLSMDYEVFLLSRVREHYLATGDNDASVIAGLASTARVITSAALIMVSVFLGFVLGADPTTKMLGLGLATAIFVDATIVRMVLVPATMTLMGSANWWLPSWLDRRMPNIDLDGEPESGAGAPIGTVAQAAAR